MEFGEYDKLWFVSPGFEDSIRMGHEREQSNKMSVGPEGYDKTDTKSGKGIT